MPTSTTDDLNLNQSLHGWVQNGTFVILSPTLHTLAGIRLSSRGFLPSPALFSCSITRAYNFLKIQCVICYNTIIMLCNILLMSYMLFFGCSNVSNAAPRAPSRLLLCPSAFCLEPLSPPLISGTRYSAVTLCFPVPDSELARKSCF